MAPPSRSAAAPPRVLVSILNWNKAAVTLECLAALLQMSHEDIGVDILVIDNGSKAADYEQLSTSVDARVQVLRVENNLGFTGGHNLSLKIGMERDYDFVWLLNNDAIVQADTLAKLVGALVADLRCGAVSPVIFAEDGVAHLNAWGAVHDWQGRDASWMQSAALSKQLHHTAPERICLAGTAILFRVAAIRRVGLLDDRLFAYFDDNDIGARLAHDGWRSKIVFDAGIIHGARHLTEQPLYFFYLMFRNEMIFWHTHMPKPFRTLLWLKLVNQGMYKVNRLVQRGMVQQADSALLGVWDFICGRHGAPELGRKVPWPVKLVCRILKRVHETPPEADDIPEPTPAA